MSLSSTLSNCILKTSSNGNSTMSLGGFQWMTILTVKNVCLVLRWNLSESQNILGIAKLLLMSGFLCCLLQIFWLGQPCKICKVTLTINFNYKNLPKISVVCDTDLLSCNLSPTLSLFLIVIVHSGLDLFLVCGVTSCRDNLVYVFLKKSFVWHNAAGHPFEWWEVKRKICCLWHKQHLVYSGNMCHFWWNEADHFSLLVYWNPFDTVLLEFKIKSAILDYQLYLHSGEPCSICPLIFMMISYRSVEELRLWDLKLFRLFCYRLPIVFIRGALSIPFWR